MSLRVVSLNIERSSHLEIILPFLSSQKPDAVCLQELMEYDVAYVERSLGMHALFAPMNVHKAEGKPGLMGVGIFSPLLMTNPQCSYYAGDPSNIPHMPQHNKMINYVLVSSAINKENETFYIANTHFPWTPDGSASDFQREAMQKLLTILSDSGEFVLCGDFNAPRGGEIFAALATRYQDNIPPEYVTSLDRTLHRAGHLDLVVDGLFSTPQYRVFNVEMICGVSDHCALVGEVEKVP